VYPSTKETALSELAVPLLTADHCPGVSISKGDAGEEGRVNGHVDVQESYV
jgi:hypothetical protein